MGISPGKYCRYYSLCTLSCSQVSATHLTIGHPQMKSTGARSAMSCSGLVLEIWPQNNSLRSLHYLFYSFLKCCFPGGIPFMKQSSTIHLEREALFILIHYRVASSTINWLAGQTAGVMTLLLIQKVARHIHEFRQAVVRHCSNTFSILRPEQKCIYSTEIIFKFIIANQTFCVLCHGIQKLIAYIDRCSHDDQREFHQNINCDHALDHCRAVFILRDIRCICIINHISTLNSLRPSDAYLHR